ncbi:hypothetical protein [uncultured Gimesia sp.]|uniref:hypothetical protein n=1 Tax=uncultured Gimesia sp. TaxID=1678688 RepID=UPI002628D895|nr:hypothetical protein [uncultured Gimesia sp.]
MKLLSTMFTLLGLTLFIAGCTPKSESAPKPADDPAVPAGEVDIVPPGDAAKALDGTSPEAAKKDEAKPEAAKKDEAKPEAAKKDEAKPEAAKKDAPKKP